MGPKPEAWPCHEAIWGKRVWIEPAMYTEVSTCMRVRLLTVRVGTRREKRRAEERTWWMSVFLLQPTNVRSEVKPKNNRRNELHQCLMSRWGCPERPSRYKHRKVPLSRCLIRFPLQPPYSRLSMLKFFLGLIPTSLGPFSVINIHRFCQCLLFAQIRRWVNVSHGWWCLITPVLENLSSLDTMFT